MRSNIYCETCDDIVNMIDEESKETNTGKKYYQGTCEICGAVLYDV